MDPLVKYDVGFSPAEDWEKLFFQSTRIKDVAFPPAVVPAELAFSAMLQSNRSEKTESEIWTLPLPDINGLLTTKSESRLYIRGEVEGLPKALYSLGLTIHLMQDMTVPHHTLSTLDLCHADYEFLADELESQLQPGQLENVAKIDNAKYQSGFYLGEILPISGVYPSGLYDADLVEKLLNSNVADGALDFNNDLSIRKRMYGIANLVSQWKWSMTTEKGFTYETILPSGSFYPLTACTDIYNHPEIMERIRYHYNLAIAGTVFMLELAAHQYELLHQIPAEKNEL